MDKQTLTRAFQLMLKNTIKGQLSKISLLFSFTCLFPLLEVAVFRCDLSQCMLEIQLPRQRFSWKVLVNFSVAAPHLWNSLPKDAHLVSSLTCLPYEDGAMWVGFSLDHIRAYLHSFWPFISFFKPDV